MKIHAGKFVSHPTANYLVFVAACGKKNVPVIDTLGLVRTSHMIGYGENLKVTCKTCIKLMQAIKCESPL